MPTGYKCGPSLALAHTADGEYTLDRAWTVKSKKGAPLSSFTVHGDAKLSGSDLHIDFGVTGIFDPTGTLGEVVSYSALLTPSGLGAIHEKIQVKFASGALAVSNGDYVYSGSALEHSYKVNVTWNSITAGLENETIAHLGARLRRNDAPESIFDYVIRDRFDTTITRIPEAVHPAGCLMVGLVGMAFVSHRRIRQRAIDTAKEIADLGSEASSK